MGSAESSEGRRVSFGMDEEERVRVLQGIRLSDHVVNRMKDSSQPSKVEQPTPPPSTPPPSSAFDSLEGKAKAPEKESKPQRSKNSGAKPSGAKEDLLRRYEQEQAIIQDEIFQLAKREREAAAKHLNVSLQREGSNNDREKQKSAQLNAEMYKLSSEQFHEAALKMESTIKPRRAEPVCSGLQAQILQCYRQNVQEVLLCSDLVKAYQRCVSAAHKG
ncbi:MICOS complex subunit MIC25 isoform X2 [Loxodonta africana]|uniref:MICOS complex subunit MIC25 isoform X3 n=1 Tax=Elephas maximus indicus TaxID=99487 RepID=UPI0021168858|nr:MICOS complex subunit MIC25 isoform X3 [Elephas maximus indicus]